MVMSILKGETSIQEAARKHGLTVAELEEWKERFLGGAENALRSRPRNVEALKEGAQKRLNSLEDQQADLESERDGLTEEIIATPESAAEGVETEEDVAPGQLRKGEVRVQHPDFNGGKPAAISQ